MRNIKVSHSYIFFFPSSSISLADRLWKAWYTRYFFFIFFFFIFFLFLFFLKEIIHRFPPSIMQRVKCNRDVFLWWILQKNTIKRARWKTDTRHICINFSSWYFIRLFISQSSSSTMSCILLNSIILIEFFEFAFL